MTVIKPFRYFGGKFYLVKWILSYIPKHSCYVEPFGGSATVLLNKPPSRVEVYNDLDGALVNCFRVLQQHPEQLLSRFEWAICSRQIFYELVAIDEAYRAGQREVQSVEDAVEWAFALIYRLGMGYGGIPIKKVYPADTSRGMGEHFWSSYRNIKAVHERLKCVSIEHLDYREILQRYDREHTLFYIDPPYLFASKDYVHTLNTESEHRELLERLLVLKGKVLLSGYSTPFYDEVLLPNGWSKVERSYRTSIARGNTPVTEALYMNYEPPVHQGGVL